MKRYLLTIAALLTQTSAVLAQQTEISYRLGEVYDIRKVPVIVSLSNTTDITGVGAKLYIPEDATCIYEDVELADEPDVEKASRCTSGHTMDNFSEKMTSAGKRVMFYFTSKRSQPLAGNEGDVVTFYMDCSKLADGDYEITTKDNEAVTTKAEASFNAENPTISFTIINHNFPSAITEVGASENGAESIYTLDGIKRTAAMKGQVNVVNGRKVLK